jgi:hypothetical protein
MYTTHILSVTGMFDSKTTKFVKPRKKRIYGFLATLFCTLVIVSSIGSSFGIRNSFAQKKESMISMAFKSDSLQRRKYKI